MAEQVCSLPLRSFSSFLSVDVIKHLDQSRKREKFICLQLDPVRSASLREIGVETGSRNHGGTPLAGLFLV